MIHLLESSQFVLDNSTIEKIYLELIKYHQKDISE